MGLQVISSEIVDTNRTGFNNYGVLTVASESRPGVTYRIDFDNKRCSCPAWTRSRPNEHGMRPFCKHLKQVIPE